MGSEGDFGVNFLIGEVATGVGTEPMAIRKGSARAEAAPAEGKVLAGGTAATELLLSLFRGVCTTQFLQLGGRGL